MRLSFLFLASLVLCGCEPSPEPESTGTEYRSNGRFTVQFQSTFRAAQKDRAVWRSVYVITDINTGVEYLAVEGCGTAQLVVEHRGKQTVVEER